ncbi:geranylgeranylglyceryl/heptaprenylglyceryl phosphate synthase [candidate division WOR-3 bacterium]|nr:geranylgeranylglyceryl/heptaprenylglyceryl phosphate synthase [candidate division WOR-3 bacterium]
MKTWNELKDKIKRGKNSLLFPLLDPDKIGSDKLPHISENIADAGCDAVLVGGSTLFSDSLKKFTVELKKATGLPVIIFPGNSKFIIPEADAVFFLTLLSGRNPRWLIEEQLENAVFVKKYGLESIPVAYLLIESGKRTAVEFVSNTNPIPRDKIDILAAHVMAAECMGMKNVYLEAGSGAVNSVPGEFISCAGQNCTGVVIAGGGIKEASEVEEKRKAGADIIVVGTALERDISILKEMTSAAHARIC